MTFSLPEELASRFLRNVPARDRSRYVASALASKLKERELALARACEVANRSRAVRALERELDALDVKTTEPWDDGASQ